MQEAHREADRACGALAQPLLCGETEEARGGVLAKMAVICTGVDVPGDAVEDVGAFQIGRLVREEVRGKFGDDVGDWDGGEYCFPGDVAEDEDVLRLECKSVPSPVVFVSPGSVEFYQVGL